MTTATSTPPAPPRARSGAAGSAVNVLALALGMGALLLILAFLSAQLSWDRMHHNFARIYRVTEAFKLRDQAVKYGALSPLIMAETLEKEWPEIAAAGRIMPYLEGTSAGKVAVRLGGEKQVYEYFSWADPSILQIFTLPFAAGDPRTALAAPNSLIISETVAHNLFGSAPAVGRTLKIDSGYSDESYLITGVFKDLPFNSHFHLAIVASFSSLDHVKDPRILRTQFWVSDTYTYVLLAPGASIEAARGKFPAFVAKHFQKIDGASVTLFLQSLGDIHLRSHQLFEFEPNGDIKTVRTLAWVAAVVFLLLCLNFMTLSTAPCSARAPIAEGAGTPGTPAAGGTAGAPGASQAAPAAAPAARRGRLFGQLFGEALKRAVAALILAVVLAALALPALDRLTGEGVTLPLGPAAWGIAVALVLVVSLAAAVHGACSRAVMEGRAGTAAGAWRTLLAVAQVAAGVALLVAALLVRDQLRFARAFDLGFDMHDVIVVPIRDVSVRDHYTTLKASVERIPGVLGTTFSSLVLGQQPPEVGTFLAGFKGPKDLATVVTDHDFVKVLRLALVAGRAFSAEVPTDLTSGFIINESAVRLWGVATPQQAIGKTLNWNTIKKGAVIGVVRDFHNQPLQVGIEPVLMHIRPIAFRYMYVRLAPQNTATTIAAVGAAWHAMVADKPFDYFFLADRFNRAYDGEQQLGRLLGLGALLVLIVAALLLIGLGRLPGKTLLPLLLCGWLAGCLLALWRIHHWLAATFDRHTSLHPLPFVAGALAVAAVAVLVLPFTRSRTTR